MSAWLDTGDTFINLDTVTRIEKVNAKSVILYLGNGEEIRVTNNFAANVILYLSQNSVKFVDADNPTRDF